MKLVRHFKNKHYAKLKDVLYVSFNARKQFVQLMFTEDSKYDMNGDEDQGDWNKVVGRASWHRFFPFIKSIYDKRRETFITWRYFPNKDIFQVAEYFRLGDKHWTGKVIDVPVNTFVSMSIAFFEDNIPVGAYFGGHDSDGDGIGGVAPNDLNYKIQFI